MRLLTYSLARTMTKFIKTFEVEAKTLAQNWMLKPRFQSTLRLRRDMSVCLQCVLLCVNLSSHL
jgi:hypothetical protein